MMRPQAALICYIFIFICILTTQVRPALAACTSPNGDGGEVIYNSTEKLFQYCNDTKWVPMHGPGSGSGGCTMPDADEGQMLYNADHRVLQGCAGNVHKALGPVNGTLRWTQISAGIWSTCGIKSDGTAWCWGSNRDGLLGTGDSTSFLVTTPKLVSTTNVTGSRWVHISTAQKHTCGVRDDYSGYCWGNQTDGALGNGVTSGSATTPQRVSGNILWKEINAGYVQADVTNTYTCGVSVTGAGYCWGNNSFGRLGLNTGLNSVYSTPQPVASGLTWKTIVTSQAHTCGIDSNEDAYCWGNQSNGRLGNGNTAASDVNIPTLVLGPHKWLKISIASQGSCGITTANVALCWGANTNRDLGDNSSSPRSSPVEVNGAHSWKDIAKSDDSTCGILTNGDAYCWGRYYWGKLGQEPSSGSVSGIPIIVPGGHKWESISGSVIPNSTTICSIRTVGDFYCWGRTTNGKLGNGTSHTTNFPVQVANGGKWLHISNQEEHTCGVKLDNSGWCWGVPNQNRLGVDAAYTGFYNNAPRPITDGYEWAALYAGTQYTCGLQTNGDIRCWGLGTNGVLGNNSETTTAIKGLVDTSTNSVTGTKWIKMANGHDASCAIRDDNSLWCWGNGGTGAMGDGSATNNLSPNVVSGGYQWKDVSVGDGHVCGVQIDGTGWCWGANAVGELGSGGAASNPQLTPYLVAGNHTWKEISAGRDHSCGVTTAGALYCWGEGASLRLGSGNTTDRPAPYLVQVPGGSKWLSVRAVNAYSCALNEDKSIWCWGGNTNGSLGNGNSGTGNFAPQKVVGGSSWKSLGHTLDNKMCAISVSDDLLCWGFNYTNFGYEHVTFTPAGGWCSGPDGRPGAVIYNSEEKVMQYCDGVNWVGIGDGAAPPSMPEGVPTEGLVGYWQMNEGSGTHVGDSSGMNNHGTRMNTAAWATGFKGGGISGNGTNSTVAIPHHDSLSLTSFTAALWMKPNVISGDRTLINRRLTSVMGDNYFIELNGSEIQAGFHSGSWREITTSGAGIVANVWYHIAVTFDNTTKQLVIYKNGHQIASSTLNYVPTTGNATLYLNKPDSQNFNGVMDEVRVYNRALRPAEIRALISY